MRKRIYTALIMLLGAFASGSAVYAAETCPKDSVIGYDQNDTCVSRHVYNYDEVGHVVLEEDWMMGQDSVLIGTNKIIREYDSSNHLILEEKLYWSKESHDWIGTGSTKTIYRYDANGNTILHEAYNMESGQWKTNFKNEYEYNNNNKQILYIRYTGDGEGWIPLTKTEADYDTFGNQTLDRYWSSYDTETSSWVGKYWHAYTFNANKQKIEAIEYSWVDGKWKGVKYVFGYDDSGNLTHNLYFSSFDENTKEWIPTSEIFRAYDSHKNQTLDEQYTFNEGVKVGVKKEEYGFDEDDNQVLQAIYQWDVDNSKWIGVSKDKTLYDENENLILDEQYTWSGNDWVGSKKEEYIYDANKLVLSTIAYAWDVVNKTWINGTKVLADYNTNKMQILDERYQWITENGGYWQGTKKDSTVYDAKNVETASFKFQWDDENRRWLGNTKYRKEFDAANNLILEEQYNWQMVDTMAAGGFWKGIKKEEYAYNAAKQQTLAIIYAWSDAIEDWIGNTKKISDFDINKNQTLNEQYTWVKVDSMASGGYWQGTEKATYTFNKNKQQTSSWVYAWNDADTAWVYSTRDTASYDAKKNQTLDERYTWDAENDKWVGTLKKEYAYNASGQQIMFAYYQWDNENNKWIGTQKEEDEQDAEGRTIMHATYTWYDTDWKGKSKDTYTYFRNDTVYEHITYEWKSTTWVAKNSTIDSYSEKGEHKSTATFKYDATNNAWIGQKLTAWAYTETGKIWIQEEYVWGTTDWVKNTRLENTYTDDKLTAYTTFKWDGTAWVNVKHWEQPDANTERTYEWYNNAWSRTQEKTKTYTDGKLTQELNQNWSHGVPTEGSKTEYTYMGSNLTQKSNYTYDSGISDWVETDRLTNAYDETNLQTLTMTQTFSGGVQTAGDKTTNTYNAEGKQTNTTTYKWENNDWQNVSKTDSEYSGNTIVVSNWQWDVTKKDWVGTTKEEKAYGEGKDVTITAYEWNTTSQSWQGVSKTGYTYYPNGKEKSVIDYRWTGSDWVADTKTEYEYSGSKNIVTATYQWENDAWEGQSKIGYYYDEGEDLTTATWDWKDSTWVGNTKMGETFDQFKNRTGQTTYTWNGTDFVYKQKTQIEYGISSKDKTTAIYEWDADNNSWKGQSKSGVTYNGAKIASEISYTWVSGFDWEYTKKTEYEYEGTNANDKTTATYTWDSTNKAWVGVSKSGVTYATNGKIASEFSYVWGGTDWKGVKKTEYEYGDGKNNSVAQYVWGDSTWVGKSKIAENYTEQGDSLSLYTYCWKNNDWADSLKQEYTYNEYGDIILFIKAAYVSNKWKTQDGSSKWEIAYYDYETHKIDSTAKYTWKSKKNMWVGSGYKLKYKYDEWGLVAEMIKYQWVTKSWQRYSRIVNQRDAQGHILLNEQWQWNSSHGEDGDWEGVLKSEASYDAMGNKTMFANYYRWDNTRWEWIGSSKEEHIFDEEGNELATCYYLWSTATTPGKWIGDQKLEYRFDEQGRVIASMTSKYDTAWYYYNKMERQYDSFGNNVLENNYTWNNDEWVLTYTSQKEYDKDDNYKLRDEISGEWNADGSVKSYSEKYNYYACDPKFTIIVNTQKEGVGEVKGSGIYTYYARPKISALEDNCATFTQWDDGDKNATRRVLVTEDKTYTAIFSPVQHTIRASVRLDSGGAKGGSIAIKRKE